MIESIMGITRSPTTSQISLLGEVPNKGTIQWEGSTSLTTTIMLLSASSMEDHIKIRKALSLFLLAAIVEDRDI